MQADSLSRRRFLGSSASTVAAVTAGVGLPLRTAHASVSASDLNFIFVMNNGGWDPTRVFAPQFGHEHVDMELDAEPATAGGITYVAHEDRPSVDIFMNAHHEQMVVINGLQVRSIAHEICTMIALTGSTSGYASDWPAIIAADAAHRATLPHLVLGGPNFPGELGAYVARTGRSGQLGALLSDDIMNCSYPTPRRKTHRHVMDVAGGTPLTEQAAVGVDALSQGLSRCVSMSYPGAIRGPGWDSHAANDDTQSQLFEDLFAGLGQLMETLRHSPGSAASTLAEETVVVVLSEMGRTPQLNATAGKDHWPYTSMMLVGPNLASDRVVGAFDEAHYGVDVDMASGDTTESGRRLSVESVGGALLALAGIDPAGQISGAEPFLGLLA